MLTEVIAVALGIWVAELGSALFHKFITERQNPWGPL